MLLIIERDPQFSQKLKKHLKIEDLETFLVESAADAVFLVQNESVQFILIDLNAVSDWADLFSLQRYGRENNVPLLFIEGRKSTAALAQRLHAKGKVEAISLPFRVSALKERIHKLISASDAFVGTQIGPEGQKVTLIRKLGAGSMGSVYEGHHEALDRKVAVKFLLGNNENRDLESSRRFLQEARAMANIRSPHVAQIFFTGSHLKTPYLVMEYVDGPDLDKYLRAKGCLSQKETLRLIREILLGLVQAHEAGKIHRDLKPANIMLNPAGQAVILDFGLVRESASEGLTQTGTVLGTPRYISPEQVQGKQIDTRSDLYSVGIMMFEMLIGQAPFRAPDLVGLLMKHVTSPIPDPASFNKTVHPDLFSIIVRLTEKEPGQRYSSATEALQALSNFELGLVDSEPAAQNEIINVIRPLGGMAISETGSIIHQFGEVADEQAQTLHILRSALTQLELSAPIGKFERGLIHSDAKRLLLFSYFDGMAAMETSHESIDSAYHQVSAPELMALFESEARS